MSVRVISYRFIGDSDDLEAAVARSEASLKSFKRTTDATGDASVRNSRKEATAAREVEKAEKAKAAAAQRGAKDQEQAAAKAERAIKAQAREEAKRARAAEVAAAREIRAQETLTRKRAAASEKIGTGLLIAGGVGAFGLAAVVSQFADFDQAMSRAQAGTQATGQALEALRRAALKAGADTQYSATEAADGITALGKAGVSTKDILAGGLKGALDLAAAGQIDVAQAAEISAVALNQFKLSGAEIPHVADLLAAGAGKANGEVTDMANALKYVGPVAEGMNVSLEQTVGVLAELAQGGVIGEQAGTSARGLLLSLSNPSKIAAKEMRQLGIDVYDTSGKFVGFNGVAGQLQGALGGLSAAQRDAALGVIFGNEQITAARILYSGGAKAVEDWTDKVNDTGFAARQAAVMTDNLRGDIERLGGSLSTVFIQSGSGTNDGLRQLTQAATGAVNAFSSLPDSVQKSIVQLGALGAGVLLLAGGLLIVIPRIRAARIALNELALSGTRAGRALTLAGKGTAGLAAIAVAIPVFDGLQHSIGGVSNKTDALAESLAQVGKNGKAAGEGARGFGADFEGADSHLRSFTGETESLAEAVERINKAHGFTGSLINGIPALDGSRKTLEAYGEALSSLVQAGRSDEAGAAFDVLAQKAGLQGAETSKLLDLMPTYKDSLIGVASASGTAATNVATLAGKTGELGTEAQAALTKLTELSVAASAEALKAFSGDTDVLSSYKPEDDDKVTAATDRLTKARKRLADVEERISKQSGKTTVSQQQQLKRARDAVAEAAGKQGAARTEAASADLAGTYKRAIDQAEQFTRDITAAEAAGLDPQYIAKLLKQGPEQAGPILRELVSDHSGRLIDMVNSSERSLSKLGQLAAEQARLTSLAVNSGTDELTSELGNALRVAQATAELGADATAEGIARRLKLPKSTVNEIAADFGINLVSQVQAAVSGKTITVQAKIKATLSKVTGLDDTSTKRDSSGRGRGVIGSATGGYISGPGSGTSDSIPAMLSNGEFVQPTIAVDYYGLGFMEALRSKRIPRMADGGLIGTAGAALTPPGKGSVHVVTIPLKTTETVHHHDPIHVGQVITRDLHSFTARDAPRRFSAVLGAS